MSPYSQQEYYIPAEIELFWPKGNIKSNALVQINWNDKYLSKVPHKYKNFFRKVHKYLNVRTTDVHVCECFAFYPKLVDEIEQNRSIKLNRKVIAMGLILHDIGWSKLTNEEIQVSLGIKGLELNETVRKVKLKHLIQGEMLAKEILEEYKIDLKLTETEIDEILKAIRLHDKVEELGEESFEIQTVADLDHLWSFTYLNFWQDTIRKDVKPDTYLSNLKSDLKGYLVTPEAQNLAINELIKREEEVKTLKNLKA